MKIVGWIGNPTPIYEEELTLRFPKMVEFPTQFFYNGAAFIK